jgi:hypothetical protein
MRKDEKYLSVCQVLQHRWAIDTSFWPVSTREDGCRLFFNGSELHVERSAGYEDSLYEAILRDISNVYDCVVSFGLTA